MSAFETAADADELDEAARRRFEASWREGEPLDIEACLPPRGAPTYLPTLEELVHVELELAWRTGRAEPRVEGYLERFPALGEAPDLLRRLVRQELVVRHRHGDRPAPESYRGRFPELISSADDLRALARLAGEVEPAPAAGPGAAVGRFRIGTEHARGGFGLVWRAEDERLGRTVALKQLRPQVAGDADVRRRFLSEARITAQLEHPGVVPVYELIGDGAGPPSYAMKLVHGDTLEARIVAAHDGSGPPRERDLAAARLLDAVLAVARTVAFAHARGVIHRDLKPQNVILGDYGETLVLDWGLAKVLDDDDASAASGANPPGGDAGDALATRDGALIGTPAYMAPEQARGEVRALDRRSDVFALGAILYRVLTGRLPFGGSSTVEVLARVCAASPPRPRQLSRHIARPLEAICLRALAGRPADRYPDAGALAADLERYLAGANVAAYREGPLERAWRWGRRHRLVVLVGAAALLLLAAGAVVTTALVAAERDQARTAEADARAARDRAEALRAEADAARAEAEHQLYVASVALAHRAWRAGDVPEATRQLAATPAPMRGWEWRYLQGLCHPEVRTLAAEPAGRVAADAGQTLVAAAGDGQVRVWRVSDGADGESVASVETGLAEVRQVVLLASNRLAVRDAQRILAWSLADGAPLGELADDAGETSFIGRSDDGLVLVTVRWPNLARFVDAATGAPLREVPLQTGRYTEQERAFGLDGAPPAEVVAVSGDLGVAATADLHGDVRVTDLSSGALVWERRLATTVPASPLARPILGLALDGLQLAVVIDAGAGATDVHALDAWTGAPLGPAVHLDEAVHGPVWMAGGRRLVLAGERGPVVVDPARGVVVARLVGHAGQVRDLAALAGSYVVTASEDVRVWDLRRQQEQVRVQTAASVGRLAFDPDSERFVTPDGAIWSRWSGGRVGRAPPGAFASDAPWVVGADGRSVLFAGSTPRLVWRDGDGPGFSLGHAEAAAATPDGRTALTVRDGILRRWDVEDRQLEAVPRRVHPAGLRAAGVVAFGPERLLVLARRGEGDGPGALEAWTESGARAWALDPPSGEAIALGWSDEHDLLAAVVPGEGVGVWRLASGVPVVALTQVFSAPSAVGFTRDGRRLIVGDGETLRLWDTGTWREVFRLALPARVGSVATSPDGRSLGVGLRDGGAFVATAAWPTALEGRPVTGPRTDTRPALTTPAAFAEVAVRVADYRRQEEIETALLRAGGGLSLGAAGGDEVLAELHRRGLLARLGGPPGGRGTYVSRDRAVSSTVYGSALAPLAPPAVLQNALAQAPVDDYAGTDRPIDLALEALRVAARDVDPEAALVAMERAEPGAVEVGLAALDAAFIAARRGRVVAVLEGARDPWAVDAVLERLARLLVRPDVADRGAFRAALERIAGDGEPAQQQRARTLLSRAR